MSFFSKLRGSSEPAFHDLHRIPSREDLLDKENVSSSSKSINLFSVKSTSSTNKASGKFGSFRGAIDKENSSTQPSSIRQPRQAVSNAPLRQVGSSGNLASSSGSVRDSRFASNRPVTTAVPSAASSIAPSASQDSWYNQALFGSIEPDDDNDNSTVLSGGSVQTFQSHHLNPVASYPAPSDERNPYSPPSSARSYQSASGNQPLSSAASQHSLGDYQYRSNAHPRVPSQQNLYAGIAAHTKPTVDVRQHHQSRDAHYDAASYHEETHHSDEGKLDGAYFDADYDDTYPVEDIEDMDFPASASQMDDDVVEMVFSKARHDRQEYVLDMLLHHQFNPNSRDQYGNTLLHVCAQNNHRSLAAKIIKHCGGPDRVDVNARNKKKLTPLDFCDKYGHVKFRMWLTSFGAVSGDTRQDQFHSSR
eukprot:gene11350-8072_t